MRRTVAKGSVRGRDEIVPSNRHEQPDESQADAVRNVENSRLWADATPPTTKTANTGKNLSA